MVSRSLAFGISIGAFWGFLIGVEGLVEFPSNYSRLDRPNEWAVADLVSVSMDLHSISRLNEGDFEAEILLKSSWEDPRLSSIVPKESRVEGSWIPDFFFKGASVKDQISHVRLSSNGLLTQTQRLLLRLKCQMSFVKFPFDQHTCRISMRSLGYNRIHLELIWRGSTSIEKTLQDAEMTLMEIDQTVEKDGEFSLLVASISLRRCGARIVSQGLVPASLLGVLGWLTLFLIKTFGQNWEKEVKELRLQCILNAILFIAFTIVEQMTFGFGPKGSAISGVQIYMGFVRFILFLTFGCPLLKLIHGKPDRDLKPGKFEKFLVKLEKIIKIGIPISSLIFILALFAFYLL